MFKDWKTTLGGLLAFAATAYRIYATKTVDAQDLAFVSGAVGLLFARDSKMGVKK